jgi:hypothetical protein
MYNSSPSAWAKAEPALSVCSEGLALVSYGLAPTRQAAATRRSQPLRIDRQVIVSRVALIRPLFDVGRDDTTLRFDHTIAHPRDGVERGEDRAFLPVRDIGCGLAGEHNPPVDLARVVVGLRLQLLRPLAGQA